MKTTLISLDFKNWRGFTGLIEFNPDRNVFSGPNGSGKTRIPDAVSWNLTGKDTRGKADSELKSIVDGSPVQKSEHSVISKYDIDGRVREFGRCYYEKWSTKRGSAEKTKDGNQTNFTVDGIEVSKTKYNAAIASAFGENYSLCSGLSAVTGMEWKKRRELLTSIPAEIKLPDMPELIELAKGRSLEDAKKAADQRKKDVKKKILETNAALEERQADVDKVGGVDKEAAEIEVKFAGEAVSEAKAAIEKAKGGDQSENIEKLKELNDKLFKAESEFQWKLQGAATKDADNSRAIESAKNDLKNHRENLQDHQEKRQNLLAEYNRIKDSNPEQHPCQHYSETCPYYGEQVEDETLVKFHNDFNVLKSERLELNITSGKETKAEIQRIEKTILDKESELKTLEEFEPDRILKEDTNPEIHELKLQIGGINSKMSVENCEIPAELIATLEACETRLTQAQETRAAVKSSGDSVQRLEDLKTKKSELSAENDRIEKFLSFHQQYEQALADAIEKPVNDMFKIAYFKMFDTLEKADEDGNFKQVPACIVMDKEKRPFETALSNGERIQVELDIIRVMQEHFDISSPIFIDNSESVTDPIELNCQFIELRATDEFETLTKEV